MSVPAKQSGLQYRPDIDGLRAIAVLAVLFCHAELGLPGGYVGVDVFFVISGYLITGLILKDLRLQRFSMLDFWERRIRRILPALAATLVATLAAAWFVMLPDDYVGLGKSTVAVALLSANLYFWRDTGYFAQVAEEKPLLHTWSLAVEEQFYLFVPFGLALIWWLWRGRYLMPLLALATLLSFLLSVSLPPGRANVNFYFLPTRAWELFAGSLLAIRPQFGLNPGARTKGFLGLIGIVLILWPCITYTKETPFPGMTAIPPVLGAVLIIWSGTGGTGGLVTRMLASRPMVFIGLVSYSLYLWHWPLLAFARYLAITPPGPWLRGGLVAASIPLAILSWKYIETPFRKRSSSPGRRMVLACGFATLLLFMGIGGLIWMKDGFTGRLPDLAQTLDRTGGEQTRFRFDYNPRKIPASFHPLGDQEKKPSILVWGDSFSMSFMPVADAVLGEQGYAGLGAGYAAMAPVLNYSRLTTHTKEDAHYQNQKIVEYLRESDIKAVWLVACWKAHLHIGGPTFESALKSSVAELLKMRKSVCFVIDPPSYAHDIRRLLVRKSMRGENLSGLGQTAADYLKNKSDVRRLAAELAAMGVTIMDPMDHLLDAESPWKMAVHDGLGSFYSDNSHLSRHGSMRLKPMICQWLAENPLTPVPTQ